MQTLHAEGVSMSAITYLTGQNDIPAVRGKVNARKPRAPALTKADAAELGQILEDAKTAFTRHVIFADPDHTPDVLALYAVLDYCRDAEGRFHFPFWLYVYLRSKGTAHGKTRIMRLMQGLTEGNSGIMISPNEAQLIRMVSGGRMLLWDEVLKSAAGSDWGMRCAVLTSGIERGGAVPRVSAASGENDRYETFGPKMLASRNNHKELPDDVLRRCYVVETVAVLRPRLSGIARWNPDAFEEETAAPQRARASAWAARPGVQKVLKYLGRHTADIEVPDELAEYQAESWSPLIALARLAPGEWAKKVLETVLGEAPGSDEAVPQESDTFDNDLRTALMLPTPLFKFGNYYSDPDAKNDPAKLLSPVAPLRETGLTDTEFGWSASKGRAQVIGSVQYKDGRLYLRVSKATEKNGTQKPSDWHRLVQLVNKKRTFPGEYQPDDVLRDYRDAGRLRTDNPRSLAVKDSTWDTDAERKATVVIDITGWLPDHVNSKTRLEALTAANSDPKPGTPDWTEYETLNGED